MGISSSKVSRDYEFYIFLIDLYNNLKNKNPHFNFLNYLQTLNLVNPFVNNNTNFNCIERKLDTEPIINNPYLLYEDIIVQDSTVNFNKISRIIIGCGQHICYKYFLNETTNKRSCYCFDEHGIPHKGGSVITIDIDACMSPHVVCWVDKNSTNFFKFISSLPSLREILFCGFYPDGILPEIQNNRPDIDVYLYGQYGLTKIMSDTEKKGLMLQLCYKYYPQMDTIIKQPNTDEEIIQDNTILYDIPEL